MSYFETVYADALLSHRAKSVYMYLYDRVDGRRQCWYGIQRIASDLHLSRSTIKRALTELEQRGYLRRKQRVRENGGRTSNLYTLL